MASERITLTVPGPDGDREVSLSSPNRVIWPVPGITKRDLAPYKNLDFGGVAYFVAAARGAQVSLVF